MIVNCCSKRKMCTRRIKGGAGTAAAVVIVYLKVFIQNNRRCDGDTLAVKVANTDLPVVYLAGLIRATYYTKRECWWGHTTYEAGILKPPVAYLAYQQDFVYTYIPVRTAPVIQ